MYIPLTRHDIITETASVDWQEIKDDFEGLTEVQIYNLLIKLRHSPDRADRLASAIIQEFNRF
jgi:hypothetical protein